MGDGSRTDAVSGDARALGDASRARTPTSAFPSRHFSPRYRSARQATTALRGEPELRHRRGWDRPGGRPLASGPPVHRLGLTAVQRRAQGLGVAGQRGRVCCVELLAGLGVDQGEVVGEATTTTPSAATSITAAVPTSTAHERKLGQLSWTGRSRTPTGGQGMGAGSLRPRFTIGDADIPLVHGSPGKVNEYLFEDKPARPLGAAAAGRGRGNARVRAHPQALDPRTKARAIRQLRLGRQAQGRRPPRGFAVLQPWRRASTFDMDADAVAPRRPCRSPSASACLSPAL